MSWSVPGALGLVCPRYGLEVLGGAETVVRQLAERLQSKGYEVEVCTTCAVDHYSWDNYHPEGTSDVNGITVRRFEVQKGSGKYRGRIGSRITAGIPTSFEEQELWLNDGFRSAGLFHWMMQQHQRYHTILLTPYMFWTTYACSQVAPEKNVLRPCLHDETFARLDIYRPMFRDCRGIVFNSQPEADTALRLFELPKRWEVAGEGVEIPESFNPQRFRQKFGIEFPYLAYTGRREWGKNVDILLEMFQSYLATHSGSDLCMVLMGRGEVHVPPSIADRVIDLGFVSDEDKADAMAGALAVCQPSLWESFSRLIMDAWLAETPVLGFGGCDVTAYHINRCEGGLIYMDEVEFELALDLLVQNRGLRETMGRNGKAYVLSNYRWEDVIGKFVGSIDSWAAESLGAMAR